MGKNPCANDNFPKPQTRKPANNRVTYVSTLFLKLIAIYIYIYSLSSYLAEDSVFPSMLYIEIVAVKFEYCQKHINALCGQKMYSS